MSKWLVVAALAMVLCGCKSVECGNGEICNVYAGRRVVVEVKDEPALECIAVGVGSGLTLIDCEKMVE